MGPQTSGLQVTDTGQGLMELLATTPRYETPPFDERVSRKGAALYELRN